MSVYTTLHITREDILAEIRGSLDNAENKRLKDSLYELGYPCNGANRATLLNDIKAALDNATDEQLEEVLLSLHWEDRWNYMVVENYDNDFVYKRRYS